MSTTRANALNQALDVAGSQEQASDGYLPDEPLHLGFPISGQTGSTLLITSIVTDIVTVSGLSGMTSNSITNFITVSDGVAANNGTFSIINFISTTSVTYRNIGATLIEPNNGSLSWIERSPYSLQDDLNYIRTDRAAIKGVGYEQTVTTYERPDAIGISVNTNLTNISGKTLDAKYEIINKKKSTVFIPAGSSFITITDTGNFPHSSTSNLTGIPLFDDPAYLADYEACYVGIITNERETTLETLTDATKTIFGLTRAGSSTSPNSIEIEFRQVGKGQDFSTSVPYTWEEGQIATVDFYYGFSVRSDLISPTANRLPFISGITINSDAGFSRLILETNGALVYVGDGEVVLKT